MFKRIAQSHCTLDTGLLKTSNTECTYLWKTIYYLAIRYDILD